MGGGEATTAHKVSRAAIVYSWPWVQVVTWGKEEQYPERLLAYICSKCPIPMGKINAACITYLLSIHILFFKKTRHSNMYCSPQ